MPAAIQAGNPLRLVNSGRGFPAPALPARDAARAATTENTPAPGLSPTDARWVLAVRAAHLVEGGRAALLTPERRRCLMVMASSLGLRPFDATLVIAIVQDAARAGLQPLGRLTEDRLGLIRPPQTRPAPGSPSRLLIASTGLGIVVFSLLLAWLRAA